MTSFGHDLQEHDLFRSWSTNWGWHSPLCPPNVPHMSPYIPHMFPVFSPPPHVPMCTPVFPMNPPICSPCVPHVFPMYSPCFMYMNVLSVAVHMCTRAHTHTRTHTHTHTHTHAHVRAYNSQTDRRTHKQTDRQTDGQTDTPTDEQTDKRTAKRLDRQTYGQTYKLAGGQTIHSNTTSHIYILIKSNNYLVINPILIPRSAYGLFYIHTL